MVPFGGPPNRGTFLSLLSAQSEYLRKVSHSVRAFWSQRRWRLRLRLHVVFFLRLSEIRSSSSPPPLVPRRMDSDAFRKDLVHLQRPLIPLVLSGPAQLSDNEPRALWFCTISLLFEGLQQ